jgi:hypothetical protein
MEEIGDMQKSIEDKQKRIGASVGDRKTATQISQALDYLRRALAIGPMLVTDLTRGTELHPRTLRRAAARLEVRRRRGGVSGPWIWSLPPEAHLFAPSTGQG